MSYGYKCSTCSRKDTDICDQCLGDQYAPKHAPAPEQNAEALADEVYGDIYYGLKDEATKKIEADRAAQRQAGRDEIAKALNLAIGCMNENPSDEAIDAFKSDPLINRIVHILRQLSEAQRQAGRNEALVEMADNAVRLKKHYDDALAVIDARYAELVDAAREANGIHDLVQSIERNETYTDGEPEWATCRMFGQIKASVLKLGKALSDLEVR